MSNGLVLDKCMSGELQAPRSFVFEIVYSNHTLSIGDGVFSKKPRPQLKAKRRFL